MKAWVWGFVVAAAGLAAAGMMWRTERPVTAAPQAARVAAPQQRCATPHVTDGKILQAIQQRIAAHRAQRGANQASGPVTIDVQYIHITNGSQGTITEQQRVDQIAVMNAAFSGSGVQFSYTRAPKVANNAAWFTMTPGSQAEFDCKTALHEDPTQVLNFYTARPGGGLLGWATFPWELASDPDMDGVVILDQSLPGGTASPYNLGQTATHEVGHWVGLFHTFQGACNGTDDQVTDTVAHANPNFGCPAPGRNGACQANQQAPIHNYMNYTDDACMTEFTTGQITRLLDMIDLYRNGTPSCSCPLDCAATRLPGPFSFPLPKLPSVRRLRDQLLSQTADGRRLTRLYYDHSSEVFRILAKDPELARTTFQTILAALPEDEGASGQVRLDPELYDECQILIDRMATKAGPQLELALEDVKTILNRRMKLTDGVVVLQFHSERPAVATAPR